LALDRNLAAAHATIGLAKLFIGRSEETEAHVREALRLSPRDTFAFSWIATVGVAKLYLGDDEEAVAWLRRAIEINRNLPNAYFYLAAALVNLGQSPKPRSRPGSRSIQPFQSTASALARRATIQHFLPSANAFTMAGKWPDSEAETELVRKPTAQVLDLCDWVEMARRNRSTCPKP
jgi:tetratricopeptide (TPR) repeat protein